MTASVESEIIAALCDHLGEMPNAWPIAFENTEYDPPDGQNYLRTQHIPAPPRSHTLERGPTQFTGIFQVTVVAKKGVGTIIPGIEVSKIVQHFDRMTTIGCASGLILITERPASAGGLDGGATYDTPITIQYELIAN